MNNNHSRYPRLCLKHSACMLSVLPLLASAWPLSVLAVELDVVVVTGEGIGSMRLDVPNQAGSRLGLTALQTPASVDTITSEEIATKGDYDTLSAITRAAGISASANPGNGGTSVSVRGFNGPGSVTTTYDGTRLFSRHLTFLPIPGRIAWRLRGAGSVINGLAPSAPPSTMYPRRQVRYHQF
jgi:iron complex outermembrane receptor protein